MYINSIYNYILFIFIFKVRSIVKNKFEFPKGIFKKSNLIDENKWCNTCININKNKNDIKNQCYFCKRITDVRPLKTLYNYKVRPYVFK